MEIIRESRGIAKDYIPLVLDLYENKNGNVKPVKSALEKLAKDVEFLKSQKDQREILIGFKSDPYPDDEIELNLTEGAIKILAKNNLKFSILTEKAENALQHFDLIKRYKKVRYGLKLLSNSNGQQLNIGEPPLLFRIESLKEANKRGIKTWVDLDSLPEPPLIHDLIRKLYKMVDQWKINGAKFNVKPESKSDWKKFEKDADGLLDSLGIGSPWTEGDTQTRKGNCNILVIAPHGHPGDDKGTFDLACRISDKLDCYAVLNKKYQKPANAGLEKASSHKYAVDLNFLPDVKRLKKLQKQFIEPIKKYKDEIIAKHKSLLILHIHGIGDGNSKRVAKLLPEFKDSPEDLHLLIGYGQHRTDNDRKTADIDKLVKPLISGFHKIQLKSAIAPTEHITVNKNEKRWYCGNDKKRLNQELCEPRDKVQSLQLEFKWKGIRDNQNSREVIAQKFADALKIVWSLKNSESSTSLPVPAASKSDLDKVYTNLMAIVSKGFEKTMLEAGRYLIDTFYGGDPRVAHEDKKRQSLNSLNQYIVELREKNPVAPRKSWIYNAVNLVIEHENIKAHSDKLFHTYGKLPLSHKVLLFPVKDMGPKEQLIKYADEHRPTVVEFREIISDSKPGKSRKIESNPSLLSLIGNPEKLIATEISKLLTPESLQKRNLPELKKLHSRASDCILAIQEKIEIQTEYLTRYKEISDTLEKVAKDKAGKSQIKAQPELKTVTPV